MYGTRQRLLKLLGLFVMFSCLQVTSFASTPPVPAATSSSAERAIRYDPPTIAKAREECDLYHSRCVMHSWFFWTLSVAAAGSAISTAIRSAYSPSRKPKSQEEVNDGRAKGMDGLLVSLAILTVVATALESSYNPKELSARYCFGQLQLEKALFKYDSITGPKTETYVAAVTAAYFQAESVLQYGLQEASKEPQAKDVTQQTIAPEEKSKPVVQKDPKKTRGR